MQAWGVAQGPEAAVPERESALPWVRQSARRLGPQLTESGPVTVTGWDRATGKPRRPRGGLALVRATAARALRARVP